MIDTSVRTLVHALISESHHNFHKLFLTYNSVGRNVAYFSTLAQLTGLQYLKVRALRLENMPEMATVLAFLTQLKVVNWILKFKF